MPRGFILQSTYRLEAGRPVVHLFGRLEDGASFLIRDRRSTPSFFILRADAARASALGARLDDAPGDARRSMSGDPVERVLLRAPADAPPLRDRLRAHGIPCFEADIPFATRYLIERGIRGAIAIEGPGQPGATGRLDRVFDDPELVPADWTPRLSVLSLDIETDPRAERLLSVALYGKGVEEVLLVGAPGEDLPERTVPLPDERTLLATFVRRVAEIDPDVLTGWNVAGFDLAVLERVSRRRGIDLVLGRTDERLTWRDRAPGRAGPQARIPGRLVLDGIDLVRGAFVKLPGYSLESASRHILGRGKTISGKSRARDILDAYRSDRGRFCAYNLNDARLVTEILERLGLVELAVERSRLTGLPPDRVGASIASFDFLYLSALGPRRIVAPSVNPEGSFPEPTGGGEVLEPRPGLFENVLVLDFKSLYPTIIRTFNIDPLGFLPVPGPADDPITAPNGAAFSREPGILPALIGDLFPRREAALAAGDRVAAQAIKILMNSFYGVLGTPACRFASPALANAITGFGRDILLWSKAHLEAAGYDVLYGDTDSLFVRSAAASAEAARRLGRSLEETLNQDLARQILERWRVESHLSIRFDRLYLRFFLPSIRHGEAGARKRYAGLMDTPSGPRVVLTGLEAVRSDWTALAQRVQAESYERFFTDRPLAPYLREIVADLRDGRLDDQLVYRKSLRKKPSEYTATTPPHVVAARLAGVRRGAIVAYVMTVEGPQPAGARTAPLDLEHYVARQVRPVVEPILAHLGLDFDRAVGDDAQLPLF